MPRNTTEMHELHVTRQGAEPLADAPSPGTPLDIVVSDALTRYWILERPNDLDNAADPALIAAERFREIYGDDPSDWVIRVDPMPGASRWLACAIPSLFAVDLPKFAERKGWRTRHIQPRFLREFDRHCSELGSEAAFCVASRESTTIGLIDAGNWHGIRVHPPLTSVAASFDVLLLRDCRQAGMATENLRPVIVGSLRDKARLNPSR